MKKKLSKVLEINTDKVNIKATTTEGLGFCGREEGIAAQSIVLLK
jgi:2-C-methyl-D-erythritol 2,4-cyclodiphosphate synthase